VEADFVRIKPDVTTVFASFLACSTILAPAWGETLTYQAGGETVQAYLGNFPGSRNSPGMVIIHDYWGLNDQIKGTVDRLTRLGYVVLAPDLFKGKLVSDPGLAQDMRRALDEERAVTIVKGAIDELRKIDRVNNRMVATIGFGMGGRVSLAAALRGADVQATVLFYGSVPTTREGVSPLKAPILGVFGGGDHAVPEKDVTLFQAALKEAGMDAKIVSYPGVGHCFMDETRSDYEPEEAKDAWIQMRDWLAVKLEPKLPSRRAPVTPAPEPAPQPTPP
jgi:carboxymethylenebutenolidase